MLDAELIALATAAGTAVAQAAGTDAWTTFRERVARAFGCGHAPEAAQQAALERLDRTAAELESAEPGAAEQARGQAVAAWRTRFQDLLEDLGEADRDQAAARLRELVDLTRQARSGISVGDEGIAVGGNMRIEAREHAAAAVKMGDVTIVNPLLPGPEKG